MVWIKIRERIMFVSNNPEGIITELLSKTSSMSKTLNRIEIEDVDISTEVNPNFHNVGISSIDFSVEHFGDFDNCNNAFTLLYKRAKEVRNELMRIVEKHEVSLSQVQSKALKEK